VEKEANQKQTLFGASIYFVFHVNCQIANKWSQNKQTKQKTLPRQKKELIFIFC
jgi:hypothetical protein